MILHSKLINSNNSSSSTFVFVFVAVTTIGFIASLIIILIKCACCGGGHRSRHVKAADGVNPKLLITSNSAEPIQIEVEEEAKGKAEPAVSLHTIRSKRTESRKSKMLTKSKSRNSIFDFRNRNSKQQPRSHSDDSGKQDSVVHGRTYPFGKIPTKKDSVFRSIRSVRKLGKVNLDDMDRTPPLQQLSPHSPAVTAPQVSLAPPPASSVEERLSTNLDLPTESKQPSIRSRMKSVATAKSAADSTKKKSAALSQTTSLASSTMGSVSVLSKDNSGLK